jgi:DNA-binding transcriptional MerR regulator
MATQDTTPRSTAPGTGRTKSMTIGAVCKALEAEFPDISISKIRYLEDQKLLSPRRTPGGYRLYSSSDVERLRAILRMQRDEFLPLRVIRQELASGRTSGEAVSAASSKGERKAGRPPSVVSATSDALFSVQEVMDDTRADLDLLRELEEYGVVTGTVRDGARLYDETEREIVRAAVELARYGVGGRNLRVFRTSADREAALLEQILAPSLQSRQPQRRKEAVDALESLAATTTHLKHLLMIRDLRRLLS